MKLTVVFNQENADTFRSDPGLSRRARAKFFEKLREAGIDPNASTGIQRDRGDSTNHWDQAAFIDGAGRIVCDKSVIDRISQKSPAGKNSIKVTLS